MTTGVWNFEVFLVYAVILRSAECAITGWTAPLITGAAGSGTLTSTINDGVASGTPTGITVTATADNGDVTYTLVSQTPTSPSLAIDDSGVVTVTSGAVSYSSATSFTLDVSANDDGGTASSATVTLNVNAAPAISSHSSIVCIQEASTQGVNLIDLTATDPNSGTTIIWAIAASGNTGTAFAITAGSIEVATGKTLNMATTPSYTLVITAADDSTTPLTATTTLTASVQTTCPTSTPAPTTLAVSVQTTRFNGAAAVAINLLTVLTLFLVNWPC